MFINGNISFQIDTFSLSFEDQPISIFGLTELPWGPLNSTEHYGKSVFVKVVVLKPSPLTFTVPAQITREITLSEQLMGLKFHMDPDQEKIFNNYTRQHGEAPTLYSRKYPRIPSNNLIQTFPLRTIVDINNPPDPKPAQAIFDVENISPGGIMISTENRLALKLEIRQEIDFLLDPRGWFPYQIQLRGSICRILDDFNSANGNTLRHLGIKFTTVNETHKQAFSTLLKDILIQIKKQMSEDKKPF